MDTNLPNSDNVPDSSLPIQPQIDKDPETILDIYRKVAITHLKDPAIESMVLSTFVVDEHDVPTAYTVHKEHFTAAEWTKICLFEKHFIVRYGSRQRTLVSDILKRKEFLGICIQASNIGNEWAIVSRKAMQSRAARMNASETEHKMHFFAGGKIHIYEALDTAISTEINTYFPGVLLKSVCVPSQMDKFLNVLLEVDITNHNMFERVSQFVSRLL